MLAKFSAEDSTPQPTDSSERNQSWQVTLDLYQAGHTLLAIAERRMLSPSTVASHLVAAKRDGIELDLGPALPPSGQVQLVRQTLSDDPDASVAELHERLDYRLSRAELRLVLAHLRPPEPVDR